MIVRWIKPENETSLVWLQIRFFIQFGELKLSSVFKLHQDSYNVVWNGMEWYGMVSMIWYSIVWSWNENVEKMNGIKNKL